MQISEELIKQITNAVLSEMGQETGSHTSSEVPSMAGRDRINEEKTSYRDYPRAKQGTDPKEVVIGVGAAFQKEIKRTICGILLEDVLKNVKAGIEEEGMIPRVVKILDTSDVCFMALEAAKLSGSGIGIGIQSKGTTVIHQSAAKYVKGEQVVPIPCTYHPMSRPKYQVKAALMHIAETEQLDPEVGIVEWEER